MIIKDSLDSQRIIQKTKIQLLHDALLVCLIVWKEHACGRKFDLRVGNTRKSSLTQQNFSNSDANFSTLRAA